MKLKHNFISFGKVNFKKILNIFTKIEKKLTFYTSDGCL